MRVKGLPVRAAGLGRVVAASLALASPAWAQAPAGRGQPPGPGPLVHNTPWAQAAERGRAAMRAGDCAAALDAFDDAARRSVDPTVLRDRGLCHEKLGHREPAARDFEAYLYARPDAADADDIAQRLTALRSTTSEEGSDGRGAGAATNEGEADGGKDAKGAQVLASAEGRLEPMEGIDELTFKQRKALEERDEEAIRSPLRRGKGFAIGFYLDVRGWQNPTFGIGVALGASLRYSVSQVSTFLAEAGFSRIEGASSGFPKEGASVFLGYEARIRLDRHGNHNVFLGGGLAYEHLEEPAAGLVYAALLPRGRAGYRAVLGPALGLEIGADGGGGFLYVLDPPTGVAPEISTGFIGLKTGLVLGF